MDFPSDHINNIVYPLAEVKVLCVNNTKDGSNIIRTKIQQQALNLHQKRYSDHNTKKLPPRK